MYHFTKAMVRRWTEKLLHIHDSPERTAAAFALGICIGFSPFLGLHTVIGLLLAFTLNLNRVAILIGMYVHLPWFMGPYYAAVTAFGCWLTGTPMPPNFLPRLEGIWGLHTWSGRIDALGTLLHPLLVPYLLGGMIVCVLMGIAAYPVSLGFIRARRKHHPQPPEVTL
jgi:uncharacterized protein (DUF2062 family)